MKLPKLLIAVAVLCILGGLIYWVTKHPQDKGAAATPATTKLLGVPDTQIQSVDVQKKGGEPLALNKDKGKWTITAPAPYAADQDAVTSMVSSLSDVSADSVIEEHPGNLANFGLAEPAVTVTAHEKNGKTDQIYFGDDIPAGAEVYARVGKDPKVYAVSSSLKSSFNKDVNDLRDKRLLTFDSGQVSRLELTQPTSDIDFGKLNQTEWQIVKPGPYRADSFQVEDLLRKLADAKMDLSSVSLKTSKRLKRPSTPEKQIADCQGYGYRAVFKRLWMLDRSKDRLLRAQQRRLPGTFKISERFGQADGANRRNDFRNKKLFRFWIQPILSRLEIQLVGR